MLKGNESMNITENPKKKILEIIQLAIGDIRDEAVSFTKVKKAAYDSTKEDIVTSADKRAQIRYVGNLTTHFPHFGIIGEENDLNIPPMDHDHPIYFTVDPLDGTKAYARHQSYGVATMLALVFDNEVNASFVADINTGDIYGYYGDEPVKRTRFGIETVLSVDTGAKIEKTKILYNDPIQLFPEKFQAMSFGPKGTTLFKSYEVAGGSTGLLHARLWVGEIGALVLNDSYNTPWDDTPLVGINKKLGFVYIKFDRATGVAEVFEHHLPKTVSKKGYIEIVVHKNNADKVLAWLNH